MKTTSTTISSNGKFYQCVERKTSLVSVKWKVFHVVVFLILTINAFVTSWSLGHILASFNYNCVLYSSLSFNNKSTALPTEQPIITTTISNEQTTIPATELVLDEPENNTEKSIDNRDMFQNKTFMKFENETYYLDSTIDLRRSVFSDTMKCDMVLFVPLISMIFAAVLGVILAICSRGGAGYPNDIMLGSHHLVYPIIFVSAIFAVANSISCSSFVKGFNAFCENFEAFTGTKKCNVLIDIFTIQFNESRVALFHYYLTTKYTFYIGISLWCFQILITLLRLFCFVDYDLYNLEIKDNGDTEDVTTIQEDISLDTTEKTTKV